MVNSEKVIKPVLSEETRVVSREMSRKRVFLSRLKRKLLNHIWILRILILVGVIAALYLLLLLSGQIIKKTKIPYYFNLANNFIFTPKGVVDEIDGRTNILILGKGGEGHEAPDLTDTILFLSLNHADKKLTMISLPRDIWLPDLRTKLNSVYYWGNKKEPPVRRTSGPEEPGGGLILAKASVEEIIGQPVHYAAVLDFSGFKTIIDVLGGVEVDVETSFTDEKYPVPGRENDLCDNDPEYKCRYETLRFVKGRQLMDGETALKFARSRNAEGDEGTDFARQKRQQKIIKAMEEKMLARETLFSPKKIFQLKNAFLANLETDIGEAEGAVLARNFLNSRANVTSFILPEEMLVNPPKSVKYDNLYVFIPKDEDPSTGSGPSWSEIQKWVKCILESADCS
jgi:LCP family protein required for cell wall assembly